MRLSLVKTLMKPQPLTEPISLRTMHGGGSVPSCCAQIAVASNKIYFLLLGLKVQGLWWTLLFLVGLSGDRLSLAPGCTLGLNLV